MTSTEKKRRRDPSYRLHRASGKAIVTINGVTHYLGAYNSQESRIAYRRLLGAWEEAGTRDVPVTARAGGLRINDLIDLFLDHVDSYYVQPDGSPDREAENVRRGLLLLHEGFGRTPAADFGPRRLTELREKMIDANWSRGLINQRVAIVRRMFRWAEKNELVIRGTWESLRTVEGLKRGRTRAKEGRRVHPVAEEHVEAVLAHVTPTVATMIQVQLATGMRPGELVLMRNLDIDKSTTPWVFTPREHKTQHHGHSRQVALGPEARKLLAPYLGLSENDFVFSPRRSEQERHAAQRARRQTPLYPSHLHRTPKGTAALQDSWDVAAYRRAIAHGVRTANAARARAAIKAAILTQVHDQARPILAAGIDRMPSAGLQPIGKPKGTAEQERRIEVAVKVMLGQAARKIEARKQIREKITPQQMAELTDLATMAAEQVEPIKCWHPHQLRHLAATRLRRQFGLEAARVVLGHKRVAVTEAWYAEIDHAKARAVVEQVG